MDYWFCPTYHGVVWNNETEKKYGYDQQFINTVEHVRNHFGLWRTLDGREVGQEWVPYLLGQPGNEQAVDVYIHGFRWNLFRYDEHGYPHMQFNLFVKLRWSATQDDFADKEIVLVFPSNYPRSPPKFYTKDYEHYDGSHDHHTHEDGKFCMLTETVDWHKGDTVISAINVALNHVVMHYQKFQV